MSLTRTVARPLLAGIFVASGVEAVRHPDDRAKRAEAVTRAVATPLGLPDDPVLAVRVTGAVQATAGTMLAAGRLPRLSAAVLAATVVPVTAAEHRFWEEHDPERRAAQRSHLLEKAAILGGLILAATDRRRTRRSLTAGAVRKLAAPAAVRLARAATGT